MRDREETHEAAPLLRRCLPDRRHARADGATVARMVNRLALLLALTLAAVAAGCGDNFAVTVPAPTGIQVNPAAATLEIADTLDVTARYDGDAADGSPFEPDDVVWSSSDATKVAVQGGGGHATLTAVAAGHADITARGEGFTATIAVDVTPAHLIAIALPVQPRLAAGTTKPLVVTGSYSDGTTADVTAQATITVGSPAIASYAAGVLTGLEKGDSTLRAELDGHHSSTLVTVTDALLVSIAVTGPAASVPLGVRPQLVATGTYTDASTQNLSAQVTWTSSDTTIATIAATGIATPVAVGGPTTITAAKGAISGTTTLSVNAATPTTLAIAPHDPTVALGAKPGFTATATFSDSTTFDVSAQTTWASDTPATATIDAAGRATTVAAGTATITGTFLTVSGTSLLTVTP